MVICSEVRVVGFCYIFFGLSSLSLFFLVLDHFFVLATSFFFHMIVIYD